MLLLLSFQWQSSLFGDLILNASKSDLELIFS